MPEHPEAPERARFNRYLELIGDDAEVPEAWHSSTDLVYVRADLYEEAIRQRDACLQVVRDRRAAVESRLKLLRVQLSDLTDDGAKAQRKEFVKVVEADLACLTEIIAACSPPLAPGDVKTDE